MTFVAVVELRVNSKFLEHEYTADAEEVFLLDTVLPVAAIELVCDRTVELAVHVEVGIEQIELHAAYVYAPNVAVDYAAGVGHFKNHGVAIGIHNLLDRQLVKVLWLVVGNLLAVYA